MKEFIFTNNQNLNSHPDGLFITLLSINLKEQKALTEKEIIRRVDMLLRKLKKISDNKMIVLAFLFHIFTSVNGNYKTQELFHPI